MTSGQGTVRGVLDWAVAARPLPGETASGDRHLVVSRHEGALIVVVDALGHGTDAAQTASRAIDVLAQRANEPFPVMLEQCDRALAGSRGVVLSAAIIDGRRGVMWWAGVGNVSGLVLQAGNAEWQTRARLLAPGGIVGGGLPSLRPATVPLAARDVLVLATDGVRGEFADRFPRSESPLNLAEQVITSFAKDNDDALVLVAQFRGQG